METSSFGLKEGRIQYIFHRHIWIHQSLKRTLFQVTYNTEMTSVYFISQTHSEKCAIILIDLYFSGEFWSKSHPMQ